MKIQPPKIEITGLETAPEGEKVLQIIWLTLFWAVTLGAQLAPAASVLLLGIKGLLLIFLTEVDQNLTKI